METELRMNRAALLRLTTAAAVGSMVAGAALPAGGESVEAAPATQGQYGEAPMLTERVQRGELPPVVQRLPENPYVVPHAWLTPGKYGGWMQWACTSADDWGTTHFIQESMYGHSPLRWLKDGLEIGPGLAERWETNEDTSVWTFYFRKGLKWSDGQPWTVDDILFWWEDEVQIPDLNELPPDEARSGKGTLMQMRKIDDYTLQLIFDAPAPLTADRLAMWVKRGIGPRWMDPKHYLAQFHPKYNPDVDRATWVETFTAKRDFATNPECPTMTGWMLESYTKGQNSVWVRNPYYWCVDQWGNQLPYIDGITQTNVQDAQVLRLRITSGQVDYVHGGFVPLTLADVSVLRQAEPRSRLEVRFWDSGSGTSSMYFFNYDYADPKMRALIREPKFRKALSHAYNRANVQKVVYFNTGELTTGTLSPKALEYNIEGGRRVYEEWRDSALRYDPDYAKRLLDEIGVTDKNRDGWREMPDGSPLVITLDYPADQPPDSEHVRKNELLAKDWQAIGLNAKLNPVTPTTFGDQWAAGQILTTTAWEVGDGPNHLVYPQWLVPLERQRWAPLEGTFYAVRGTPKEREELDVDPYKRTPPRMAPEAGGPIDRLWQIYDQTKVEPDVLKRIYMVWDMIKIHVQDGPFFSGTVANTPRLVLVKQGLRNVPRREDLALGGFVNPWIHPTPAVYDPEAYYWEDPAAHPRA
jgi:peptide/nickel transport system substrate-binding protein